MTASPVPDMPGILFYGPLQAEVPFGEGYRGVGGNIQRMGVSWGQGGVLTAELDFGDPVAGSDFQAGHTWNFQAWYRDPQGGGHGFNLSDGYMISFIP